MGRRPKPISVEFCKTTPLGRREMRPHPYETAETAFALPCYTVREHDPEPPVGWWLEVERHATSGFNAHQ